MSFSSIVVIGRGLIGGSIELAIRGRRLGEVVALDRGDDLASVAHADLVVLAAPVLANLRILDTIRDLVGPSTIVTDVGSTKATIVGAAGIMRFVGGHPIAGAALGGRENARADLFVDQPWVLSAPNRGDRADAERVEAFVRLLGAHPTWMDAATHDRLFGFLSHLPQLATSALLSVVAEGAGEHALSLAGPGLRDTTRLAASPHALWHDIVATNGPVIREALDDLITALTALRDDETGQALRTIFESAAAAQARLRNSA